MQAHVLEAAAQTRRMHVHLAYHGGLVAAVAHLLREHMVVLPRDTVLVTHAARARGRLAAKEGGARRDATRAGGVGVLEQHAVGGERVQVGRLHVRMAVDTQAVAAHLVAHDKENVGLLGHRELQTHGNGMKIEWSRREGRRAPHNYDEAKPGQDQRRVNMRATRCRPG